MLYQRELVEKAAWNNAGELSLEEGELEPQVTVSLYDLLLAFRDVIKRAESRPLMQVAREEFSVEQMMGYLFDRIVSARGTVTLTEILPEIDSRRGLIVAFLALLELTRLKAIFLRQERPLGEITAQANPNYELSQSFRPA
jgi:segregation and condensation protein A